MAATATVRDRALRERQAELRAAEIVSVADLARDYQANQFAAEQKHRGRCRTVTGVITDIGRDVLGTAYVALGPDQRTYSYVRVKIKVASEGMWQLRNLRVGQVATARVRIGGYTMGVLTAEQDCPMS